MKFGGFGGGFNQAAEVNSVNGGDTVTPSSLYNEQHNLWKLDSTQAWSAKDNNALQWIQVVSQQQRQWVGVITQGRKDADQRVTKFRVSYSNDGNTWTWADGGRIFIGNDDRDTKIRNNFDHPFQAQGVRIHVVEWVQHISLRFDAVYK